MNVKIAYTFILLWLFHLNASSQVLVLSYNEPAHKKQDGAANVSLKRVLSDLEKSFKVSIIYQSDLVENKFIARSNQKKYSNIEEALKNLLSDLDLGYTKVSEDFYYLKLKSPREKQDLKQIEKKSFEMNSSSESNGADDQTVASLSPKIGKLVFDETIKGRILNENNEGLPGVSIVVKGTTIGTITDAKGDFSLTVPDLTSAIVVSYVGYVAEEVLLAGRTYVSIALVPDIMSLNEIVVVGYGTQKKSNLTGAIASVKSEEIRNLPVRNVAEALQGRVPGLVITLDNGNPRANPNDNNNPQAILRGVVSLTNRNPLYVVDGIPFIGTGANFNIQDIESIEVLKDASAAAIYGTLGAGGVILITTKKGKAGKLEATIDASYGVATTYNFPDLLRRDDYIKAKTAFGYDPVNLFGSPDKYDSLPDTDWYDEMYKTGQQQNYTVSLTGGSEKSNFYSSLNYNRIDGTRIGSWNERFALRLNSDHKVGKRLRVGQTLYASTMREDPPSPVNNGYLTFRSTPLMKVYDPTNLKGGYGKTPNGFNGENLVGNEKDRYQRNNDYEFNLSAYWELELLKGLKFRNNLAFGQTGRDEYYSLRVSDYGATGYRTDNFDKYNRKVINLLSTFLLSYSKKIGEHEVGAMVGYEARKSDYSDMGIFSREAFIERPQSFDLIKTDQYEDGRGVTRSDNRYLSQFGRVNYAFNNKYLFEASFRRDGSALKFGPNNKIGFFPSASVGWNISEESFMNNVAIVSNLKLRGSYGVLGNEPNDSYLFRTGYILGNSAYVYNYGKDNIDKQIGVTGEARLANPDIKWETVSTANIGIDGGLFKNKLTFSIDFYSRQTKDMIYSVPLARSAGLGDNVQKNVGQMSNKGVEVLVEYNNKVGDLTYGIVLTGSHNQNKLISLIPELEGVGFYEGGTNEVYGNARPSYVVTGKPLGQFYGYIVDGIYQDDENRGERPMLSATKYRPAAGDLVYRDLNSDGEINDADKTFIGNPWPKFAGGLDLKLGYKGFDLSLLFNTVLGVDIYNAAQSFEHTFYNDFNTTSKIYETSFFDGKGVTSKPRVGTLGNNDNDQNQNRNWGTVNAYHVQDGSFVKLRTLQLGYTIPSAITNRAGINSMRVFFLANNLFTITGYKGMDPEIGGSIRARGVDSNFTRYPLSRLFSLGLNLQF